MGKKKGKKKAKKEQRAVDKATERATVAKVDELTLRIKNELDTSDLYAPLPPKEVCPICFLPMIGNLHDARYTDCCSTLFCNGCDLENRRVVDATNVKRKEKEKRTRTKVIMMEQTCAFCREPLTTSIEEMMLRAEKRMEVNDPLGYKHAADFFRTGARGLQADALKALELYHRAAELGEREAFVYIGEYYEEGTIVKEDPAKARTWLSIAAMKGSIVARYRLGGFEYRQGNTAIALRHWHLSAAAGYKHSMDRLREEMGQGNVSRDEYAATLQSFLTSYRKMKSEERDRFERQLVAGRVSAQGA